MHYFLAFVNHMEKKMKKGILGDFGDRQIE